MRLIRILSVVIVVAATTMPAVAREMLTVRINDASGVPGGTAAIVLRTYASRPIEQGQLCLEAQPAQPGAPGAAQTTQSGEVFSANGDVTFTLSADLSGAAQQFVLNFDSPTASVNAVDGPLAVIFIDLDPALVPGQTYNLVVDLVNTHLIDEFGDLVVIRPRHGVLTVRDPTAPVVFGVEAEDVAPGEVARVSLTTMESLPLATGSVDIVYDPAIAAGPLTAVSDPRYGNALITLDASIPGLARIDFSSTDGTFNTVPGNLINLLIPTSPAIPAGTGSPLSLDPNASAQTAAGEALDLALESDALQFTGQFSGAGEVSELLLSKLDPQKIRMAWDSACGDPDGYSIYQGDLDLGYTSAVAVPGQCAVIDTTVELLIAPGLSEFFLVVPNKEGFAGGYGRRAPLAGACFEQETLLSACAGSN